MSVYVYAPLGKFYLKEAHINTFRVKLEILRFSLQTKKTNTFPAPLLFFVIRGTIKRVFKHKFIFVGQWLSYKRMGKWEEILQGTETLTKMGWGVPTLKNYLNIPSAALCLPQAFFIGSFSYPPGSRHFHWLRIRWQTITLAQKDK